MVVATEVYKYLRSSLSWDLSERFVVTVSISFQNLVDQEATVTRAVHN